jgi:hypothetical protein
MFNETNQIDMTPVLKRLDAANEVIAQERAHGMTEAVSQAGADRLCELLDTIETATPEQIEEIKTLAGIGQLVSAIKEVADYEATLAADLIYCPMAYVIIPADESLISPAGFGPEDRVYLKPSVAYHTNKVRHPKTESQEMRAYPVTPRS